MRIVRTTLSHALTRIATSSTSMAINTARMSCMSLCTSISLKGHPSSTSFMHVWNGGSLVVWDDNPLTRCHIWQLLYAFDLLFCIIMYDNSCDACHVIWCIIIIRAILVAESRLWQPSHQTTSTNRATPIPSTHKLHDSYVAEIVVVWLLVQESCITHEWKKKQLTYWNNEALRQSPEKSLKPWVSREGNSRKEKRKR